MHTLQYLPLYYISNVPFIDKYPQYILDIDNIYNIINILGYEKIAIKQIKDNRVSSKRNLHKRNNKILNELLGYFNKDSDYRNLCLSIEDKDIPKIKEGHVYRLEIIIPLFINNKKLQLLYILSNPFVIKHYHTITCIKRADNKIYNVFHSTFKRYTYYTNGVHLQSDNHTFESIIRKSTLFLNTLESYYHITHNNIKQDKYEFEKCRHFIFIDKYTLVKDKKDIKIENNFIYPNNKNTKIITPL